ncbi:YeeE/YedE thiosulfate transporter family protein [Rhodoblastus sp.]|uniref:YeeE/YedE thiosulfate transporter family protein n=1 Tax=Rhodoblastus sp. TaxID=1962975 RepID=UPI00262E580D|nr:YeeE/YedE thiosulfate transporter family protein [Rhodoblastus sp.]
MTIWTDRLSQRAERRKVDRSPYLIGAALGVLSWIAFAVAREPIGVTTALSRVGQPIAALMFGAQAAAHNPYWAPMPFSWDYSMLFLVGLMAGALVSSLASGTFRLEAVPHFWRARFGGSLIKRFVAAFVAGALLMFGARMAGGCTSGHGLSGTLQLALSSWIFVIVVFISAIISSRIIFGRKAAS